MRKNVTAFFSVQLGLHSLCAICNGRWHYNHQQKHYCRLWLNWPSFKDQVLLQVSEFLGHRGAKPCTAWMPILSLNLQHQWSNTEGFLSRVNRKNRQTFLLITEIFQNPRTACRFLQTALGHEARVHSGPLRKHKRRNHSQISTCIFEIPIKYTDYLPEWNGTEYTDRMKSWHIPRCFESPASIFLFQQFVLLDETVLAFVTYIINEFTDCQATRVQSVDGFAGGAWRQAALWWRRRQKNDSSLRWRTTTQRFLTGSRRSFDAVLPRRRPQRWIHVDVGRRWRTVPAQVKPRIQRVHVPDSIGRRRRRHTVTRCVGERRPSDDGSDVCDNVVIIDGRLVP